MAIVGIDLGTTFSAVAFEDENGRVRIVDIDGKTTVPSVVYVDGDRIEVGDLAMNRWLVDKDKVCRWVKRAMGEPLWAFPRKLLFSLPESAISVPEVQDDEDEDAGDSDAVPEDVKEQIVAAFASNGITLSDATSMKTTFVGWNVRDGDKAFVMCENAGNIDVHEAMTAVDVSAEVLKVLKANAEEFLSEPVDEAVITCPAYFNAVEVANTRKAGELAGFTVKEIVKEPIAAAVYHGIAKMEEGQKVMICDLGGGTFDATVLAITNGEYHPMATVGNRHLGGHDWTEDLEDLVRDKFMDRHQLDPTNDLVGEQRLYEECEKAKRTFARMEEVAIACSCDDVTDQIPATRDEFEAQSEYRIDSVLDSCSSCLAKAGVTWGDLSDILLVGGSARLRRLSEALRDVSGIEPVLSQTPDLMVVYGAAIIGKRGLLTSDEVGGLATGPQGGLEPVVIRRINERALATRVYDRDKDEIVSAVIMPHGLEIPASRSCDSFGVAVDGQEFFDIPIMEFEEHQVEDESVKVEETANFRFFCTPNAKEGDPIRVTLGYDKEGGVYAKAEDANSGCSLRVEERPYVEPNLTGVSVSITPRWVVFALDTSGSMDEDDKIGAAKTVLVEKAGDMLTAGVGSCKVGIVTFDDTATRICEPTDDISLIRSRVADVYTRYTTAMAEGIQMAEDLVMTAPAGSERLVVLLTDGMPNDTSSTRSAASRARSRGVTLLAVGIGRGSVDEDFLTDIVDDFGVVDFSTTDDLRQGLTQLLATSGGGSASAGSSGGLEPAAAGGISVESQWT